jgi:putative ABC transport system permease protein
MLISLAWKNIWRNKVRSGVIMFAIIIGLFGGLFISALTVGLKEQRIKSAIENEVSNIQVHNQHFLLEKELEDTISNLDGILKTLETYPQVKAVASRIKITGMASTAAKATGINIIGVDPEKEKQVVGLYKFIADSMGTFFGESKKNSIVIGRKLAEDLKVKLKSKIVLTFQTDSGEVTQSAFRVVGIFHTNNSAFDQMNVLVRYKDLSEAIGFKSFRAHEISIALYNDTTNNTVTTKLNSQFKDISAQSWKQIMPELGLMADSTAVMLMIIMVIILLALCFGIINTMMMAVLERTRELGMLMAVGMSKRRVFWMIMLETIFLTLTGAFAGMLISAGVIHYYYVAGFDLSAFASGLEKIGYDAIIRPKLNPDFYITLTILVIITGILSSLIPARRALKLRPVDAIRTI